MVPIVLMVRKVLRLVTIITSASGDASHHSVANYICTRGTDTAAPYAEAVREQHMLGDAEHCRGLLLGKG